ncbi:MAG: SRPBCC family protein [Jatrophihabitantaceae bacterium]
MNRTIVHDRFTIERSYPIAPSRIFKAFADPAAKVRWFGDPDIEAGAEHQIDFRVGGRESLRGQAPGGGPAFSYDALYHDIVDNQRIVYSYEIILDGKRLSVSVATLEFLAEGTATKLILTELGAYLDGLDTNAIREKGTHDVLDALGRYLQAEAS